MIVEATKKVVERQNLTEAEAEQVMDEIMSGNAEAVNMAAFLTALRMKGETVKSVTEGAVNGMVTIEIAAEKQISATIFHVFHQGTRPG